MGLEIVILSEVSQTQKDKYDIPYMWNLFFFLKVQMNLFTKYRFTEVESKFMVTREEEGRGKFRD